MNAPTPFRQVEEPLDPLVRLVNDETEQALLGGN